jgi:RNA polymerase sigma-70 factor (ECF subfamily)
LATRLTDKEILEELKLIEAAKKNPARFSLLYNKYYRQIFLFVFKRTEEEELCADITAQVFLKAMLKLPQYQFKGVPFSAWLYRIASNEVNQHFREQKSKRVVSMEKSDIERLMRQADDAPGDDHVTLYHEVVLETLSEMDPEDVEIIELRFFEQRPFKEVADILGITENNAKVKVYRIIERLKKRLEKKLGATI